MPDARTGSVKTTRTASPTAKRRRSAMKRLMRSVLNGVRRGQGLSSNSGQRGQPPGTVKSPTGIVQLRRKLAV